MLMFLCVDLRGAMPVSVGLLVRACGVCFLFHGFLGGNRVCWFFQGFRPALPRPRQDCHEPW